MTYEVDNPMRVPPARVDTFPGHRPWPSIASTGWKLNLWNAYEGPPNPFRWSDAGREQPAVQMVWLGLDRLLFESQYRQWLNWWT